jgi:pimeloyl-ACP methyl ester carboxylesterase
MNSGLTIERSTLTTTGQSTPRWLTSVSFSTAVKFATGAPSRRGLLDMAEKLRSFTRPVLVVWARDDLMMPLAHADRLVELFPDARKTIVDDSWTLLPEDQPDAMAKAIRDFVR